MANKLENYDSKKELREEIRKTKNGRYELRLRVILMLKEEYSPTEIKKVLMVAGATYSRWIK